MSLTEKQRGGLNIALNESDLIGFEVDPERQIGAATFRVLTLPVSGPAPEDRRVQFLFNQVGRVAASLRNGRWDDPNAPIVLFVMDDLLSIVQSFGGLSIYGWEFIDVHEKELKKWGDRLSLDWTSKNNKHSHSITVFQDTGDRILDLCVWFEDVEIRRADGSVIPIDEFIAGGKRWWDGFYSGDERTNGFGMVPLISSGFKESFFGFCQRHRDKLNTLLSKFLFKR
jgi:hypothetical protein